MRNRGTARGGRRPQRRKLVWATTNGITVFAAASELHLLDLLSPLKTAGSSVLGCTVMRTIVNIYPISSVTNGDIWSMGLIVLNSLDTGSPAPIGAPNPNTQVELDWAWLDTRTATKAANFPSLSNFNDSQAIHYDVKSRRKVEEMGETWALALTPAAVGVAAQSAEIFVRTLIALP